MARRDTYHEIVREALEADGWTITDDPLYLSVDGLDVFIDLGGEQPLVAEKNGQKIAVEVKSFVVSSGISELERAIGQYLLYAAFLTKAEPDRNLYLAVPESAYHGILSKPIVNELIKSQKIRLIVYNEGEENITQWINGKNTQQL
jgi:hypothetical protein